MKTVWNISELCMATRKSTSLANIYSFTQQTFTCLIKWTIEALEEGMKYVQSYYERHERTISIVNFEHISYLFPVFQF